MDRKNTMGLSIEQEKDEEKRAGPDVFFVFFGVKKKGLYLCVLHNVLTNTKLRHYVMDPLDPFKTFFFFFFYISSLWFLFEIPAMIEQWNKTGLYCHLRIYN
jgi:hypothetical protein